MRFLDKTRPASTHPWALVAALALSVVGVRAQEGLPVGTPGARPSPLVGTWCGTFAGGESDLHGYLRFRLHPDSSRAHGNLWIVEPEADGFTAVRRLRVLFDESEVGIIRGDSDPFDDPNCGLVVQAVFSGEVSGDRIEGLFAACGANVEEVLDEGLWQAERLPDPDMPCPSPPSH